LREARLGVDADWSPNALEVRLTELRQRQCNYWRFLRRTLTAPPERSRADPRAPCIGESLGIALRRDVFPGL
jgi:hypothetical protein